MRLLTTSAIFSNLIDKLFLYTCLCFFCFFQYVSILTAKYICLLNRLLKITYYERATKCLKSWRFFSNLRIIELYPDSTIIDWISQEIKVRSGCLIAEKNLVLVLWKAILRYDNRQLYKTEKNAYFCLLKSLQFYPSIGLSYNASTKKMSYEKKLSYIKEFNPFCQSLVVLQRGARHTFYFFI